MIRAFLQLKIKRQEPNITITYPSNNYYLIWDKGLNTVSFVSLSPLLVSCPGKTDVGLSPLSTLFLPTQRYLKTKHEPSYSLHLVCELLYLTWQVKKQFFLQFSSQYINFILPCSHIAQEGSTNLVIINCKLAAQLRF